jgi:hypothetical protein
VLVRDAVPPVSISANGRLSLTPDLLARCRSVKVAPQAKRGAFCFTSDASGAQTQVGGSEHEGQVIEYSTRMPVAVKRPEPSTGIMVQSIGTP